MSSKKRKDDVKRNVQNWRIRNKIRMVEHMGGSCVVCGYNKCNRALTFHHIDPSKKSFGISANGTTRAWHLVVEELKKCVLLCNNCHMEVHEGITDIPNDSIKADIAQFGRAVAL